eukprot:Rhum_TRINITY_DN14330_c0_g1::Rhum_TRINITY_DN14330_c0_g1_i1::g.80446::m.80446
MCAEDAATTRNSAVQEGKKEDWWRTDESPDLPEDPAVLQERERKAKKPNAYELMRSVLAGGVERLDSVANDVGDDFVVALCRELESCRTIRRVYLGANRFKALGWSAVCGLVRTHPTITHWSLGKNHLGRAECAELAASLAVSPSVVSVDLASCTGIHKSGGVLLLSAVEQNTAITTCYMKGSDAPVDLAILIQSTASSRRE